MMPYPAGLVEPERNWLSFGPRPWDPWALLFSTLAEHRTRRPLLAEYQAPFRQGKGPKQSVDTLRDKGKSSETSQGWRIPGALTVV